jgi:hypothetical protein
MEKEILVTKSSGEKELFSMRKLRHSLERARARPDEIEEILALLTPKLYEGVSTKKIYSEAFRILRRHSRPLAARYHLKNGIMELGPSGFPFEKFVAKLFEHENYTVAVGQIVKGKCVDHEVDVVAKNDKEVVMVECKYHNTAGIKVNVKTTLYVNSRFEDILDGKTIHDPKKFKGRLITNSKFTIDAINYGRCRGIYLISWNYPSKGGLRDLIDQSGLYPLTCLTSLTMHEKKWLLENNKVLVSEIYQDQDLLKRAGVNDKHFQLVFAEGKKLCEKRTKAVSEPVKSSY